MQIKIRKTNKRIRVASAVRLILLIVLILSALSEMLFFFSIPNLLGCVMAIVAFYLYSRFVLSERNIVERPFSFFCKDYSLPIQVFMFACDVVGGSSD